MIDVGYEIGSGRPVKVPADRHIAVTGQTQLSGKTTTLEALVDRSNITAVAFVTKRGEGRFQYGSQIQPYFRTPLDPGTRDVDWQFVESVLGSTLNEKMKSDSLRLAIIRATGKAKSLAQVHEKVIALLNDAKGAREGVYTLLDAYFRKVIPELDQSNYSDKLELHRGLNVMDISESTENVQQLVIRSVAQTVMEKRRNTCIILPEAWMFIPEKNNTPAKAALIHMIRAGAGIGNLLWLDSQDFAGISKIVMRAMGVWFVGAQQEYNEVLRVLETAVVPTKLAAHEIKTLGIGQFFVLYDTHRFKTYIQPLWADAHSAAMYAAGKGKMPVMPPGPRREPLPEFASAAYRTSPENYLHPNNRSCFLLNAREGETDEKSTKAKSKPSTSDASNGNLSQRAMPIMDGTERTPSQNRNKNSATEKAFPDGASSVHVYEEIKARILKDAEVIHALVVLQESLEIKVRVMRRELPLDAGTIEGVIGLLIKDGWFGQGFTKREADVQKEALARGIETAQRNASVGEALKKFMKWGFLLKNDQRRFGLARQVRVTVVQEEGSK